MRRWGLILTSDDVTTPAGMSTAPAWLGAWTFCFRPVWKAPRCLVSSCRAWWRLRGKTLAGCAAASPLSWNHPWGYSLHFFFFPFWNFSSPLPRWCRPLMAVLSPRWQNGRGNFRMEGTEVDLRSHNYLHKWNRTCSWRKNISHLNKN